MATDQERFDQLDYLCQEMLTQTADGICQEEGHEAMAAEILTSEEEQDDFQKRENSPRRTRDSGGSSSSRSITETDTGRLEECKEQYTITIRTAEMTPVGSIKTKPGRDLRKGTEGGTEYAVNTSRVSHHTENITPTAEGAGI